jgi:putative copper resistance protein D
MEHSILHALQLSGAVVALGGSILMLGFFFPALRTADSAQNVPAFATRLSQTCARWSMWGAVAAAVAAFVNLFVDVAEIEGRTIFGGVNPATVWRFATVTVVGKLSLLRLASLIFTAAATRFPGRLKWGLVLFGSLGAAVCESLVCHAAAQPDARITAITVELSHILFVSVWLGVLLHLFFARKSLESATDDRGIALVAGIIRRFSPVALTAVGLLTLSGLYLSVRYLCTPAAVVTSAYGLTLLVKMTLFIPLFYAGYVNYKTIGPRIREACATALASSRQALLQRFGKTLELEVTAGVLIMTVAGILASVSPPERWGNLRLTTPQVRALASPHLPRTVIANPETFYGAEERTFADLQYAEFTHNWSGVMVCLLGCGWLCVSLGGRIGAIAEKSWPWLLVPFPLFIAVAADPEVWLMRKVSLMQTIRDPQLLEHQIGALLAFILVGLGWLDRRRPGRLRPLGYTLPVLMILGSLLLLGHAHSNFATSQELTNLINTQHAIFGTFGLFAGVVRWLNLRGLFPDRIARLVWPGLVIALGLFMAVCYRETL